MFFSGKELYDEIQNPERAGRRSLLINTVRGALSFLTGRYSEVITRADCDIVVKGVIDHVVDRERVRNFGKWLRPWAVVPKLYKFRPGPGDYGVGVEVEMGFNSAAHASFIARRIRNWKYVTLDSEGHPYGMEVTFPPTLYSKFGKNSKVWKYVSLLAASPERVYRHTSEAMNGTHVCVSVHGTLNPERASAVGQLLRYRSLHLDAQRALSHELVLRYFNRIPYGTCYLHNNGPTIAHTEHGGQTPFVEYKLFNSSTDVKALRKYVEVAVSLTKLIEGNEPITQQSFIAALERGYQLACKKSGTKPAPYPHTAPTSRFLLNSEVVEVQQEEEVADELRVDARAA